MIPAAIRNYIGRLVPRRKGRAKGKTVVASAQDNITVIRDISEQLIDAGHNIANIELEIDCPVVGVTPIGNGRLLTGELFFPVTAGAQRVFAFLPKGTRRVALRNATNSALPTTFKKIRMSYTRFADASGLISPQMAEMIRRTPKHVMIHTLGKTGSVSLQETLRPLPNVLCTRDHFINLPNIDGAEGKPGSNVLKSLSLQTLVSCRVAMYLLEQGRSKPDSMDVICGVRRSETLLMASVFQVHGALFQQSDLSPDAANESVYGQCEAQFELFEWWWTEQFCSTHGFSLDQLARGIRRQDITWTYRAPSGIRFRFYRIEDGEAALRECLSPYAWFAVEPRAFPEKIARANIGARKSYAELYKATLAGMDTEGLRALRPPVLRRIDELFYGQA